MKNIRVCASFCGLHISIKNCSGSVTKGIGLHEAEQGEGLCMEDGWEGSRINPERAEPMSYEIHVLYMTIHQSVKCLKK